MVREKKFIVVDQSHPLVLFAIIQFDQAQIPSGN